MPVYWPLDYPTITGTVVDPELIEYELQRIAKSHNTHSTCDFAASAIPQNILCAPYTSFVVPFGLRGSWALGSCTISTNQVGFSWPYASAVLSGGYLTATLAENPPGGATIDVNLYRITSAAASAAVWTTPVKVDNGYVTGNNPTKTYTLATPTIGTIYTHDQLAFRCVGSVVTMKNVIFWLRFYSGHKT